MAQAAWRPRRHVATTQAVGAGGRASYLVPLSKIWRGEPSAIWLARVESQAEALLERGVEAPGGSRRPRATRQAVEELAEDRAPLLAHDRLHLRQVATHARGDRSEVGGGQLGGEVGRRVEVLHVGGRAESG